MSAQTRTQWEYLTISSQERDRLAVLGNDGWELVAVGGPSDDQSLFLKRAVLSFRETISLEQRDRYYASLGRPQNPEPTGTH